MVTSIHKLLVRIMPLTIVLAVLISFRNLTHTFFQQDEWQYFGSSIYALLSSNPVANVTLPLQGQLTHFFPLATLLFLFEYLVFKTNFLPYSIVGLSFHIANSLLVYYLLLLCTKKRIVAWGSAILFSVNSLAYQPITWVAAGIGTLPGTFFLLLFFFCLLRFNQTKRSVMLIYGFFCVLTSILFKETSLFVFLFLPLVWLVAIFVYRRSFKIPRFWLFSFVALGFFYALLRLFLLITPIRSAQPEVGDVRTASIETYVYRTITIPLKAFPQSIIPFPVLRFVSNALVHLGYPKFIASDGVANPYFVESIVFDLTCYLGSALLLLLSFYVYRKLRKQEPPLANVFVASVFFIGTGALPYIFIPGKAGFFSIFEPRDLYVVGIGSSVWVALILYSLGSWLKLAQRRTLIFVLLISLIALFHSFSIQQDIRKLVEVGTTRKHLLTTIERAYTKLPQKVVFYTQSDRSYYGLPEEERILPVQSGFGRMLMVWYQDKEGFPGCLYEQQFLHDLIAEGYRFCSGRGFGYARKYETLLQIMRDNKISGVNVIGYSWNGKTQEFRDITVVLREKTDTDL